MKNRDVILVLVLTSALGCRDKPEVSLARANASFERKQYRAAALDYRNLLKAAPDHPQALPRLGLCYYQLGERARALSTLARAEERGLGGKEVRVKLATLYLQATD